MKKQYFSDRIINGVGPLDARIWFVGEAPGEQEYEEGEPFVGSAGDILINVLERNGLSRSEVRLENLFPFRPHYNKLENVIDLLEFYDSVNQLIERIKQYKPVVVVPLGNYPLKYLANRGPIGKWRGSILSCHFDDTIKCIPTFHPSYVNRDRSTYPTFDLDIKRIAADSKFRDLKLPQRELIPNPTGLLLREYTDQLYNSEFYSCDIEAVKASSHILCVGFSPRSDLGITISTETDEGKRAIQTILESPTKKVFHYGTYDKTQLMALNGYSITRDKESVDLKRPYYWDTFIAQHVVAPELPRSLEYLTSINTREPYYKTEGRSNIPDDTKGWSKTVKKNNLYIYCCKDVCTTTEIFLLQKEEFASFYKHLTPLFDYEMRSMQVAHHIGNAGFLRDEERRLLLEKAHLQKWAIKQFALDRLTGFKTNVRSPLLKQILYDKDKLGLPVRRNRNGGITTDEDAIVSLIAYCKDHITGLKRQDSILEWTIKLNILSTILEIRGIRVALSNFIRAKASTDGRVRSIFNVGGTETGRWSSSKYPDGTGYNMQTNPRDPVVFDVSKVDIQFDPEELLGEIAKQQEEEEEMVV